MRAHTRAFWFLSLALLLTGGCLEQQGDLDSETEQQDPKAPGEVLGFFSLSGSLTEDTCGAENMGAPEKWSFQVKLSRRGDAFYWLNGKEGVVGEIDKAGQFAFETRLDAVLAERRGAAKGCTIIRRDSAKGVLSKSEDSLSMKLTYAYAASADSECAEFVTGTQGVPIELPCRMTYSLSGALAAD